MHKHNFMNYFLDVPKLTKKMIPILMECYSNQLKNPDAPCTNRVSATMGCLFQRKLVGVRAFIVNGRSEVGFYVTERGKLYIKEVLNKKTESF